MGNINSRPFSVGLATHSVVLTKNAGEESAEHLGVAATMVTSAEASAVSNPIDGITTSVTKWGSDHLPVAVDSNVLP